MRQSHDLESRGGSRIVYPKLSTTLTEADLASQFKIVSEETDWAGTVARRGPSMVVLLTQLEVLQNIGHFLPIAQIPAAALSYIAKQLSLPTPTAVPIDPRTTYRQNSAIRTLSIFFHVGTFWPPRWHFCSGCANRCRKPPNDRGSKSSRDPSIGGFAYLRGHALIAMLPSNHWPALRDHDPLVFIDLI